ncbi:cyclic nucleotide-binding/CBS domain-containing protein [Conexibacter sp. CPCC 205762]|nr:CBS domain-containing protein [Conexibacter sp. CPCC 205762]MDO8196829.1 CBS domain-containing protein [Conexibacter sp. CPCC 205762]
MCKTAREFVTGIGECVSEYETVLDGARKLAAFGVDALPICGEDRTVIGILSEADVVRVVAERRDPDSVRIGLLAHAVSVVDADAPIADVRSRMAERGIASAPVTDEGRLIGMLRRADLLDGSEGPVGEVRAIARV